MKPVPGAVRHLTRRVTRRMAFEMRRGIFSAYASLRRGSARATAARHNDFFFAELGIERAAAEAMHREACSRVGRAREWNESIHFLAFAALKAAGFRPDDVLELGTASGETTEYLAALFDGAAVYTFELPDDDPIFRRFHGTDTERRTAEARINRPNIRARRANTAFLSRMDLPDFDLIWLDAGHEFPEVAWDHAFCLAKVRPGGWILSDDIRPGDNLLYGGRPGASDAFTVIEYFNARQDAKFRYLLKREDPRLYVLDRKYVAVYHNPAR